MGPEMPRDLCPGLGHGPDADVRELLRALRKQQEVAASEPLQQGLHLGSASQVCGSPVRSSPCLEQSSRVVRVATLEALIDDSHRCQ
jgi:hypothetical protein